MTNLFNILLEAIDKQLELNDPPVINQTWKRLMEEGYTADKAKELLCENLSIESITVVREGIPDNKERYIKNMMNLPKLNYDIETAFLVVDRTKWGIPFNAIEFLYNYPPSKEITNKIIFALENAYNENVVYDEVNDCWKNFPLWYAIVAENHLSEELINPVIKLFTTTEDDWDFVNEQGMFLIGKLAEKFSDVTVPRVLETIEKLSDENSEMPYLFLYDALYLADVEKYKNQLLAILKNPRLDSPEMYAYIIADMQIKEAIPILEKIWKSEMDKEEEFSDIGLGDIEMALEQLKTGKNPYPDSSGPYFKRRKHWKEHYQVFEDKFSDKNENETDEDDEPEDEILFDDECDDENENADDYVDEKALNLHDSRHFNFSTHNSPVIKETKVNRNDSCSCGSGKKYKKCCMDKNNTKLRYNENI